MRNNDSAKPDNSPTRRDFLGCLPLDGIAPGAKSAVNGMGVASSVSIKDGRLVLVLDSLPQYVTLTSNRPIGSNK
jgi:hypothetical protein